MMFITLFCTVFFLVYGSIELWNERKQRVRKRLATFIEREKEGQEKKDVKRDSRVIRKIWIPVWREFKRSFRRKMPGEKVAKIEIKLLQAGTPFGMTPVDFRLLQITLFVLLAVLGGGYALLLGVGAGGIILFIFIGIIAALILPHLYLNLRMKERNRKALRELPDFLDLLTVSLEAGLGFDSALGKLVSKKEGVLTTEFHRCLEEIRLGKTRREALSGVKERLSLDEVSVLISSIIQAERLGIGMVQVLRVQSQEVREQRKQRAEEEAMKAPVKMLFPLVLFIFPSLFIVLLGPAVIQFITTFNK